MMRKKHLWMTVAERIEESIESGEFLVGDKLPTEAEFSLKYMVNRHTLRRALDHLQERGIVESTQGRGSYVRRAAIRYTVGRRTRFTNIIQGQDMSASTRTLSMKIDKRPSAQVLRALGLGRGDWVIVIKRIGIANSLPIGISTHHFPHIRFPTFLDLYKTHNSITQTLTHSGILDYVRKRTLIGARLPMIDERDLLNVPKHVPVIVTQSWNSDSMDEPIEYGQFVMASDRVEIDILD